MRADAVISALAEIGVIILLFEVGLESNVGEMMAVGWSSLLVATLGVVAPFLLGWGVAALFTPSGQTLEHVFIGATLCATSVGITARVLRDLGKLKTREASIILGAAVIDDVLGLLILAVVAGAIRASASGQELSLVGVGLVALKAVAFLAAALLAGRYGVPRLFRVAGRLESIDVSRLSAVRTRRFGDTDLEASEIGFGTWALGSSWWGDVSDADGERLLSEALELGITFFETGDAYGQGANEELVGRVLAPHRDAVQLSTKFGYALDSGRREHSEGERPQRWDGPFVRAALEASLRRLRTDHVDLYQLHNPRMDAIDSDGCFETLEELRSEGKIRHYGVALGPAIGWREEGLRAIATRGIVGIDIVARRCRDQGVARRRRWRIGRNRHHRPAQAERAARREQDFS